MIVCTSQILRSDCGHSSLAKGGLELRAIIRPATRDAHRISARLQTAHIVFLQSGGALLVRDAMSTWHTLQNQIAGFMTSLGPWTSDDIVNWLAEEYGADDATWPWRRDAIASFLLTDADGVLYATPIDN